MSLDVCVCTFGHSVIRALVETRDHGRVRVGSSHFDSAFSGKSVMTERNRRRGVRRERDFHREETLRKRDPSEKERQQNEGTIRERKGPEREGLMCKCVCSSIWKRNESECLDLCICNPTVHMTGIHQERFQQSLKSRTFLKIAFFPNLCNVFFSEKVLMEVLECFNFLNSWKFF